MNTEGQLLSAGRILYRYGPIDINVETVEDIADFPIPLRRSVPFKYERWTPQYSVGDPAWLRRRKTMPMQGYVTEMRPDDPVGFYDIAWNVSFNNPWELMA